MPYSAGKLFLWLVMEKTHPANADRRALQPGQLNHSIRFIMEAMTWENASVRRMMKPSSKTILKDLRALQEAGFLHLTTSNRVETVITLCQEWIYPPNLQEEGYSNGYSKGYKQENKPNEQIVKVQYECTHIGADANISRRTSSTKKTIPELWQDLKRSPHWSYMKKTAHHFYRCDQKTTPNWDDLSQSEQYGALKSIEMILRLDMEDHPGSQARLSRILDWALSDPFWSQNTQALPPLRNKKHGVRKWADLEVRMRGNDTESFDKLLAERRLG